jgi:uncharacterized protein YbjT (DUF2867 family)
MKILVTGATGLIGGTVAQSLRELGVVPIVLTRERGRARDLQELGHEVREADFADPPALAEAFADVDRLLLCSSHGPQLRSVQVEAVRAAQACGVQRIVKISGSPASMFPGTPAGVASDHLRIEQELWATDGESISIRPNAFTQTVVRLIARQAEKGAITLPMGEALLSLVDARDVGAVAAVALVRDEPLLGVLEVTGPAALGFAELAEILAARIGHPVAYKPTTDAAAIEALVADGASRWYAEHAVGTLALLRDRDGDRVTDTVQEVTGRVPISVTEYVRSATALYPPITSDSAPARSVHMSSGGERS